MNLLNNIDLLHIQKPFHFATVPSIVAAILKKVPIHYDWDDHEYEIYKSEGNVPSKLIGIGLNWLEKVLPRCVNSISYSSEELASRIPTGVLKSIPHTKAWVGGNHSNFIAPNQYVEENVGIEVPSNSIVYLGQLHGAQYAARLIKEVLYLKKEGFKNKVFIIGDGYNRIKLESLVKKYGLFDQIYFMGALPRKLAHQLVSKCRVAVACFEDNALTRSKSPLKIAEYVTLSKAIVSDNVGEVQTMLGGAGYLVNPKEENGLGKAIADLFLNPNKIIELQNKACVRAKDLTWENTAKKIMSCYEQILDFKS